MSHKLRAQQFGHNRMAQYTYIMESILIILNGTGYNFRAMKYHSNPNRGHGVQYPVKKLEHANANCIN